MKISVKFAVVVTLALAASSPALAHHSAAMFDFQKTVTLEGVVKEFQWTNPHSWVQLMVADASGKQVEWAIESGAPNGMARQGWKRTSLTPGDKATILVHPLRDGSAGGFLINASMNGVKVGK